MSKKTLTSVIIGVIIIALIITGVLFLKPFQKEKKVYRVGIISGVDGFYDMAVGFKSKMAELGYVEGDNISYDIEKLNVDPEGFERAAKKFVDEKVDLIFSFPTEPTQAAKAATQGTDIPVVFAYAGVEGTGLIDSIAQPGGNLTGVRYPGADQAVKRMELLHELLPEAKRIWITYDVNYPLIPPALEAVREAAPTMGLTLVEVPVTSPPEVIADLAARDQSDDIGMDVIMLMPDLINHAPPVWDAMKQFIDKHRIPLVCGFRYMVEMGSIMGNANDFIKVGELAAPIADKVLKGTPAGTISVLTPEQSVWINYKVAQDLGINVSENLLNIADEIIR